MATGIYLNDVPLDLFLDYLSVSDISTKQNSPVTESLSWKDYKSLNSLSSNTKLWKARDYLFSAYSLETINNKYQSYSNSFSRIFGNLSSKSPTDDMIFYRMYIPSAFEFDLTISKDPQIVYENGVALNDSNEYYSNNRVNRSDNIDGLSIPVLISSGVSELWAPLVYNESSKLYEISSNSLTTSQPASIISGDNGIKLSQGIKLFLTSENTVYIEFLLEKAFFAKIAGDGENVYQDDDGLETNEPSYRNNFYTHQKAMRQSWFGLIENTGWLYKWEPDTVGLLKRKDDVTFTYFDKITKTTSYSVVDTPNNASLLSDNIPRKLIGSSSDTEVRLPHDIMKLSDIPEYSVYADYDMPKIEENTYPGKDLKNYKFLRKSESNLDLSGSYNPVILNIYKRYATIGNKKIILDKFGRAHYRNLSFKEYSASSINSPTGRHNVSIYNSGTTNSYILIPIPVSIDLHATNQSCNFALYNPADEKNDAIIFDGHIDGSNYSDIRYIVTNIGTFNVVPASLLKNTTSNRYYIKITLSVEDVLDKKLICSVYSAPSGGNSVAKAPTMHHAPINNAVGGLFKISINPSKTIFQQVPIKNNISSVISLPKADITTSISDVAANGTKSTTTVDKSAINIISIPSLNQTIEKPSITIGDDLSKNYVKNDNAKNIVEGKNGILDKIDGQIPMIPVTAEITSRINVEDITKTEYQEQDMDLIINYDPSRYVYINSEFDPSKYLPTSDPSEILKRNISNVTSVNINGSSASSNAFNTYYVDPYYYGDDKCIVKSVVYTVTKPSTSSYEVPLLYDSFIKAMTNRGYYLNDNEEILRGKYISDNNILNDRLSAIKHALTDVVTGPNNIYDPFGNINSQSGFINVYNYTKSIIELSKHDKLLTNQELSVNKNIQPTMTSINYVLQIESGHTKNIFSTTPPSVTIHAAIDDNREPLVKLAESDQYPTSAQYIRTRKENIAKGIKIDTRNMKVTKRVSDNYTETIHNNYKYDPETMDKLYDSSVNALATAYTNYISALSMLNAKTKQRQYLSTTGITNAANNLLEFESTGYYKIYAQNRYPTKAVSETDVGSKSTISSNNLTFDTQFADLLHELLFGTITPENKLQFWEVTDGRINN